MNDEILVENRVDGNGIWHVHVMGDQPIGARWKQTGMHVLSLKEYKDELRLHHLEIELRVRGVVNVQAEGWPKPRRFIMCPLMDGIRMSKGIELAAEEFAHVFHFWPGYSFTRKLPKGIENGIEVAGTMLFEAEWMIHRYVAIGGRAS